MGKQGNGALEAEGRWTAKDAERVLSAWRESGLPMSAFASRRGLLAQRLSWWKKRLEAWNGETMRLVPVVPPAAAPGGEARVCVRIGTELVIEVSGAVPAEWLAALLRELRR